MVLRVISILVAGFFCLFGLSSCTFPGYSSVRNIYPEDPFSRNETIAWFTEKALASRPAKLVLSDPDYTLWHWTGTSSEMEKRDSVFRKLAEETFPKIKLEAEVIPSRKAEPEWHVKPVLSDYILSEPYLRHGPTLNRFAINNHREATIVLFIHDGSDQLIGFIALDDTLHLEREQVYPELDQEKIRMRLKRVFDTLAYMTLSIEEQQTELTN